MGVSGISTGFPVLSQSSGQVAHVLLTRSPLGLHQCCHRMDLVRLACIRHAASVRPEPGSNSPSRSRFRPRGTCRRRSGEPVRDWSLFTDWHSTVVVVRDQCIDIVIRPTGAPKRATRAARTGFWLSLFRFQGATRARSHGAEVPGSRGQDSPTGGLRSTTELDRGVPALEAPGRVTASGAPSAGRRPRG